LSGHLDDVINLLDLADTIIVWIIGLF